LLNALAALPSFGIDMSLPALELAMTVCAVPALVAYLGLARPGRIILAGLPTRPH
jgi:hypothetical protein